MGQDTVKPSVGAAEMETEANGFETGFVGQTLSVGEIKILWCDK